MSEQSYTRRRALQRGGAGLVAGLAECGQLDGDGDETGEGNGDDTSDGDTIDGSNLYVVGTTGSGRVDRQWEGDYGVSDVSAGSRITVENVAADYELRVVWESADRGTSATLSASEGPGA